MDLEAYYDRLRGCISTCVAAGINLSSKDGSAMLVNEDGDGQFYAALAIRIEYGASPEEALEKLCSTLEGMIRDHGSTQENQSALSETGQESSGEG